MLTLLCCKYKTQIQLSKTVLHIYRGDYITRLMKNNVFFVSKEGRSVFTKQN